MEYLLATVGDGTHNSAALVVDEVVYRLPGDPSVRDLLADWPASQEMLDQHAARGGLPEIGPVDEVPLRAPVPDAPNLYMAGANYADHAREMRKLGPEDPVPKPAGGPFVFLKPTTSLIGHHDEVVISPRAERVDWEVELAVVIGRRAERVPESRALDHVAGYTVANDVSVRGRFVREDIPEPPMRYDWFLQKGWATTCPMGPGLVPASQLGDPQELTLRLAVNDVVEQESTTASMIFSVAEQIAFISSVIALVPGDVICTGTPAGVGMGKGRFLAPGDTVTAEVAGIGRLVNPVVAGEE